MRAIPFASSNSQLNDFYASMFRNTIDYGIPASISVLINFGLSDKHVMYSAENWQNGCTWQQVVINYTAGRFTLL